MMSMNSQLLSQDFQASFPTVRPQPLRGHDICSATTKSCQGDTTACLSSALPVRSQAALLPTLKSRGLRSPGLLAVSSLSCHRSPLCVSWDTSRPWPLYADPHSLPLLAQYSSVCTGQTEQHLHLALTPLRCPSLSHQVSLLPWHLPSLACISGPRLLP